MITETAVTRAQIKQQKAERRNITAQMAALRRGITLEVTSAWHEREQARAVLTLNEKALRSAEAAYEVAVQLYQAGEATTTDIIDAESERVNARLLDINARIDLRVANAKLLHATGRLKPVGNTK
jgi:outer membrane protein TolC